MIHSGEQLAVLAASVGFPDPRLAAAIALAESGGDDQAVGDQGTSFGLWQIHIPAHPEYQPAALLVPEDNARAALAISRYGVNWSPWSTYRSGAYLRAYLPVGKASPAALALGLLAAVAGGVLLPK